MFIDRSLTLTTYDEINLLVKEGKYTFAETRLKDLDDKCAEWHFLYGLILIQKAWFDSAKDHFEKALAILPTNIKYQEALAALMRRQRYYSDDYYRRPYRSRGSGCCCCCCDSCCPNFSCCDLICLDSCCECMGGDLIECI